MSVYYAEITQLFCQPGSYDPKTNLLFNDGWIQAQDAFISGPE